MNTNNDQISILFIKNNKMNWAPTTQQTQKIRNSTNLKIRELGEKYYIIKKILDKLNIKRDTLYFCGKELEYIFKDQKPGLHLQTQKRRMKEALISWYCEFFYNEIVQQNSKILEKLLKFNYKLYDNKGNMKNDIYKKTLPKKTQKTPIYSEKSAIQNKNFEHDFNVSECTQIDNEFIPSKENADELNSCIENECMDNSYARNDIILNSKFGNNNEFNQNILIDDTNEANLWNQCMIPVYQNIEKDNHILQYSENVMNNDQIIHEPSSINEIPNSSALFFKDVSINQEIDNFENGNITNFNR